MTIKTSTLRPGLLVSLKTTVHGNVTYTKKVLETEHIVEAGAEQARWETVRTVTDPKEHDSAKKARSKAAGLVRAVCAYSAFGLLCPEANADQLERAIKEARDVVEAFNETAELSRVSVYVITGRIAPDDVEAVKAINSEVRDLLADMEQGIRNVDVKAIREAASRAREIGSMLSPDAEARIRIAIDTAREAAKKIVKAGEQAAKEVDLSAIRKITESRTAFLDMDDAKAIAAPVEEGRALDFGPTAREDIGYTKPTARAAEV
jgi:hypothetical protein